MNVLMLANMSGYHKKQIEKGVLGEVSKIREEFEEFMDGVEQQNKLLQLCELADMLGAIEAYAEKNNVTLLDLIAMMELTKAAFKDGSRRSGEEYPIETLHGRIEQELSGVQETLKALEGDPTVSGTRYMKMVGMEDGLKKSLIFLKSFRSQNEPR